MCLFNLQQKYNAKATEKHSGKHSDTTSWHSSKDEAYEQAVKQLFNDKLVHDKDKPDQSDYCNCQHADQAVGQCTIRGTACAMFNSTDDVKKGKVSYQAWATDMATHKVGHVSKYADPTAAGTAAFMDLLQGYPSETSCLNASSPAPKLVMPAPAATCDARSLIAAHEGKRLCVYKDTMGHPTIGIGYNLDNPGAPAAIAAVGADYDAVRSGQQCLTDSQVMQLFEPSYQSAVSGAKRAVSSFNSLCCGVQEVMIDMDYNLGDSGFASFHDFIGLINEKQWADAATDMQNTAWCGQVKSRCTDDASRVRKGC